MRRRLARLPRLAAAVASQTLLGGLARAARLHPAANPRAHAVEVIRDVPYAAGGRPEHRLDIYRPIGRPGPWPVVLYVHGGAFHILSKDSHWMMALAFARYGYLVCNINYRLAPRHPFPAAIADTCAARVWVAEHVAEYGGDPARLVAAGESAGANLVTALAVATCYPRAEPWAQAAYAAGPPRAVVPACGIYQVSDAARFGRRRELPMWIGRTLDLMSNSYLRARPDAAGLELADPLHVFERGVAPARPLPAFFVPVGTRDPLLDDTRRLTAALTALGAVCEPGYYPGELHAFHAMVWRPAARRCWLETLGFLDRQLRAGPPAAAPVPLSGERQRQGG